VRMRLGGELSGLVEDIVSDKSKEFVVMTNHHQRPEAEGKLLKTEMFGENSIGIPNGKKDDISWENFCNTLQVHYIRETGQDRETPERPLTKSEFDWLRKTLFTVKKKGMGVGDPMKDSKFNAVTISEFEKFWEWFGVVLYHVRNKQKNYLAMWLKGLIVGFLGREEAESILESATEKGTFLLRWSERKAGKLVIVFKDVDNQIKHYLIKDEDVDSNARANLADFLRRCSNLTYIVERDSVAGKITLKPKDQALEKHYTQKAKKDIVFGYVERV